MFLLKLELPLLLFNLKRSHLCLGWKLLGKSFIGVSPDIIKVDVYSTYDDNVLTVGRNCTPVHVVENISMDPDIG